MAYFRVNTRSVHADLAQAFDETMVGDESSVVGSRPNLVASFPPHVILRLGDDATIAVDTQNLHFFDEATGAPLR